MTTWAREAAAAFEALEGAYVAEVIAYAQRCRCEVPVVELVAFFAKGQTDQWWGVN